MTGKLMFLVCEPISWGLEHVPFNSSLLRIIRVAFPHERICFYAEESHSEQVRKQIGVELAASIDWENIILPPRHSSFYRRISSDFKLVKSLLNQLNTDPSHSVLVMTGNPSLLWALKYYVSTMHKDKRIQVILHGDFSRLRYMGSRRNYFNPFYHVGTLKTALRFACHDRIQHIVLEEAVLEAIIEEMPFLQNRFSVLDHPIPGDNQPYEVSDFNLPIQFGFLGITLERKGFTKYLTVAADIKRQFPGLADFHLIGFLLDYQEKQNIPELACLIDKPSTQLVSRDEYIQRLSKLHFVCLFYEEDYEFTASGVLLDCVEWAKPIVASQLPLFEKLNSKFGDIGYLCKADEFSHTIETIVRDIDPDRYKRQALNMLNVKKSRTPEALANKYCELVGQLHKI